MFSTLPLLMYKSLEPESLTSSHWLWESHFLSAQFETESDLCKCERSQLFKKGASLSTQKMPYYAKCSEKFSCEVSQGGTEASQTFVTFRSLVPLLPHRSLSAFMSHAIVKTNIYVKYLHVTVTSFIETLLCTICANGVWPHFEM